MRKGSSLKLPADPPLKVTEKPRVRIRGIYSTALSKFFMENDFQIVQPSETIQKRLSLEGVSLAPHLDVNDLPSREGVNIRCFSSYLPKLQKLLFSKFDDVVVKKSEIEEGGVYKGVIHRPAPKRGFVVRLTPNLEGWLPPWELREGDEKGDIVVVEVKEVESEIGLPRISRDINHPGDFAVLLPKEKKVKVSRKIPKKERERLSELGEILLPNEWGIIWRTGAKDMGVEGLKEELNRLTKEVKEFNSALNKAPSLTKVRNGFLSLKVFFPSMSKRKLDLTRGKILPTVTNHHQFKSLDEKYAPVIDFTEKKCTKIAELSEVSKMVNEFLFTSYFHQKGREIPIYHKKLRGDEVILGPAKVVKSEGNGENWEYLTCRRFTAGGIYDGIEAKQENGDIGVTLIKIGSDRLITVYFDDKENLKGIYVNINTPIELHKDGVAYWDMEIDVVLNKHGKVRIIDRKKLEDLSDHDIISNSLVNWAKKKAREYKKRLEKEADKIVKKARKAIKAAR